MTYPSISIKSPLIESLFISQFQTFTSQVHQANPTEHSTHPCVTLDMFGSTMGYIPYHMSVLFILYIYIYCWMFIHKMTLTHMCYPQLTLLMPLQTCLNHHPMVRRHRRDRGSEQCVAWNGENQRIFLRRERAVWLTWENRWHNYSSWLVVIW